MRHRASGKTSRLDTRLRQGPVFGAANEQCHPQSRPPPRGPTARVPPPPPVCCTCEPRACRLAAGEYILYMSRGFLLVESIAHRVRMGCSHAHDALLASYVPVLLNSYYGRWIYSIVCFGAGWSTAPSIDPGYLSYHRPDRHFRVLEFDFAGVHGAK